MCQVKQFPLKSAWASTAHKVQGITIKKGTNVVIHGHERIPNGMYYLMLSRVEEMEQIYIGRQNHYFKILSLDDAYLKVS